MGDRDSVYSDERRGDEGDEGDEDIASDFKSDKGQPIHDSALMIAPMNESRMSLKMRNMSKLRQKMHALSKMNGSTLRKFTFMVVDSNWFSGGVLAVILVNTVLIALQTVKEAELAGGWYFAVVDQIFLGIYILEMVLKLYVFRRNYFRSGWNVFDFIIVLTSIIDVLIPLIVQNLSAFDPKIFRLLRIFRAMRAIRALRVLRTIHFLKNLQVIVVTLLHSIPALGSIVLLLWLVLYIFAIIGMGLYKDVDPGRWGNMAKAAFTLFQLITLDDWFYMFTDVLNANPAYAHIFVYLFIFIILETFIFINLFVAVIVDNLQNSQEQMRRKGDKRRNELWDLHHENVAPHTQAKQVSSKDDGRDDWFAHMKGSIRDQNLTKHHLLLLASLESNWMFYQTQQKVLDDLVDVLLASGDLNDLSTEADDGLRA